MARVRIEWNRKALDDLVASIDYANEKMEYTCPGCGTAFHPRDGKIVCPECGIIFRPPGEQRETE